MKILCTGIDGFIGWKIYQELSEDCEVERRSVKGVDQDWVDLTTEDLHGVTHLIHQGAISDSQRKDEMVTWVNYNQSLDLFKRAIAAGVQRIVYASSASVYGDGPVPFKESQELRPLAPYASSKALLDGGAALLHDQTGVQIVGLRYSNVYGPGEEHKGKTASMVSQIMWQLRAVRQPRLFHDGTQRRDWVYVKDVVRANLLALNDHVPAGVYNVGSGESRSFLDVWMAVAGELGMPITSPEFIDNPYEGTFQNVTQLDLSKSNALLRYHPHYTLETGLEDYLSE